MCSLAGGSLVLYYGSIVHFFYQSIQCSYNTKETASNVDSRLTNVLILGDIHLLGQRKRSWIEQYWIDWQTWLSFTNILSANPPDLILSLGDQLDEGTSATDDDTYESYRKRFRQIIDPKAAKILFLVGNHDAAFGASMTKHLIHRHEGAFSASNHLVNINNVLYLQLNTMAMDDNVEDVHLHHESLLFLQNIETERKLMGYYPPMVLLTHVPLYRPDDTACGPLRANEDGHVTYEAPTFKYTQRDHVLSEELSSRLLNALRPDYVFSAHTHAVCEYSHSVPFQTKPIPEYTVPTFSWGMRPNPS
ncbi:Aste57867_181 [Aphanomyces stellatus]|uniref:Aste57867_181 protein n=1 Tax=Aphanomyces stellatus TaxID=120398 RepID=A0A485K1Y5_9STRA|nr:hypothetical protein As57867_000181 [Aphanomyces stellatus]VFT77407.1 Aste57867_181 [Aphanomyces stellatus]